MVQIMSFVFLDIETTSTPQDEHNKTKITELSLLVLKRAHLLDAKIGQLPRVLHKLTLCFNPCRMIHPGATAVSGLDNELLEYETSFDMNVFNTIKLFLECQQKPVCLIAENGHRFDFPILKNHFEKLNVSLPDYIMCADSLHAFYDILNINKNTIISNGNPTNEQVPSDDVIVLSDSPKKISALSINCERDGKTEIIDLVEDSPSSFRKRNETTPKTTNKIKAAKNIKEVRRKLFYEKDEKPKESYKLMDIYKRVIGFPGLDAHRAENDCIMTAEISVAKAKEFVKWIDENHCSFSEVMPMRPGVPVGE